MTEPDPPIRRTTAPEMAHDSRGFGCFAIDLDGHVQSFDDTIRDALIARGVLYQDADHIWRLRWHGFDLEREQAAWMAVCDFCNARPVMWSFGCRTFDLPDMTIASGRTRAAAAPMTSRDDWAACAACGALISSGQRRELLRRVLDQDSKWQARLPEAQHAQFRLARIQAVTQLHALFWRHRTGEATPVPPHPFGH